MAAEFDRGPSQAIASICLRCPRPGKPQAFWTAWGPIFYRGRLDGSARLLCIASDPGPTERIAHRTLVGDAGQRVQGFLAKLGLTKSYLCVNAFPYALHPSWGMSADELLADPAQKEWRNEFYDAVKPDARAGDRRVRDECAAGARPLGQGSRTSRSSASRTRAAATRERSSRPGTAAIQRLRGRR